MSCKMIDLLFSRSRSQQELILSHFDSFFHIFRTDDPFANKIGLIVHHHKLECLMEKLDCCDQGQDHSKISKCQGMGAGLGWVGGHSAQCYKPCVFVECVR